MGNKVTCLKCSRVFDSEIEYRIHYSHNHPGPVMLAQMESPRVAATSFAVLAEKYNLVDEYALATSKEGLGELCPVLKDKFGNIIDGYHRKGENANWREETCDWIDTPEKLEAARLAVNFARRDMASAEIRERITNLVKSGLKVDGIAKLTGISERTVLKYTPQELKDPVKVEAGRTPKVTVNSAEDLQHNVKIPDVAVPRVRTFAEAAAEAAQATAKVAESSFVPGEVEEEDVPDGPPICPCCSASLNLSEYEEIKQKIKTKFGRSMQMLLFSEGT